MPDWLSNGVTAGPDSMLHMATCLATAFACGCTIALIYRFIRPLKPAMSSFPSTIVLLAILCAMLPLVIGQNVAWAFGLVGALSIVRFRTVVEDTHDITFVIFAVLVGMAVGADRLNVAIVGIVVTGTAAYLTRPRGKALAQRSSDAKLTVRLGVGRDANTLFAEVFQRYLSSHDLVVGTTSKQGASLDLTYRVKLLDSQSPTGLIDELNRIEGVQSVGLRRGRA